MRVYTWLDSWKDYKTFFNDLKIVDTFTWTFYTPQNAIVNCYSEFVKDT